MSAIPISDRRVVGRYELHGEVAHGGMATVYFGRLLGQVGFSRTVAIKRLHAQYAKDPEFISMFLDEARLAARIRHPNVVPILDVVSIDGELFMIMEYVQGEPLSHLLRGAAADARRVPLRIMTAIMTGVLEGLHAAHEAVNERGEPLNIVHRDVSPQNIMVGLDGVPRVLDFGVAKAAGRLQTTREGQLKGKLAYMAPEQLRGSLVDRRTDVYAAAVVLWEALAGQRLFSAETDVALFGKVLEAEVKPPSAVTPDLPRELDQVVLRGLQRDPTRRYQTAEDMGMALELAVKPAPAREVGRWVEQMGGADLKKRSMRIAEIESQSTAASQMGRIALAARMVAGRFETARGAALRVVTTQGARGADGECKSVSVYRSEDGEHVRSPESSKLNEKAGVASRPSQRFERTDRIPRPSDFAPPQPSKNLLALVVGVFVGCVVLAGWAWWAKPKRVAMSANTVLHPIPVQSWAAAAPTASMDITAMPSASENMISLELSTGTPTKPATLSERHASAQNRRSPIVSSSPLKATGSGAGPDEHLTSPPQKTPKEDCTPPYTLDSKAVRIPKPQCL